MADKVTLSLNPDTLSRARAEAEREGITLSAWFDRAARREALRDAGRRYRTWIDAHPDRAAILAWDEVAAHSATDAWHDLPTDTSGTAT